jgi:tRNA(Ile)-lysidine synthase
VRRGLTLAPPTLEGLERLNAPDRPPIALALSGGGDSLALLHLAKAWADGAGRALIALTVDHGLNPASAGWTGFAADRARRLGVTHRALAWRGDKPSTGLPAAARAARHALLADAARSAGARVVMMAHTADDLTEAQAMRAMGASVPSPRLWSASPAWPEGRGVFLLRPLLGRRRADLRALLAGLGEAWIDDPANDDPRFSRTLARRRLADCPGPGAPANRPPYAPSALDQVQEGSGGELTAPREALSAALPDDRRRLLGALALCAAGTTRPASIAALDRLAERLGGGDCVATLAGCRIEARGERVMFCREAGELARGRLRSFDLPLGESVFDGRFVLTASEQGHRVTPLTGLAARLTPSERAAMRAMPSAVRRALPAVVAPTGDVRCPLLAPAGPVLAAPLGWARLRAALGAIEDEAGATPSHSCSRRRCGA